MPLTSRAAGIALFVLSSACFKLGSTPGVQADEPATYVGARACAGCHASETASWRDSHHDLAMQEATDKTVLDTFDGATFTYGDVTSRFFKREGKFFVNTDGPDGTLA